MDLTLRHILPDGDISHAAEETQNAVHAYMATHPESELHTCGKMFGVLVVEGLTTEYRQYICAFSAKLDGSYHHNGYVPPVYEMTQAPVGTSRTESQRLQRLLFAKYCFVNGLGETRNLLDIFADEKPIISAEEWFNKEKVRDIKSEDNATLPPSGAGECCAPKLLQYALTHGLRPIAMAEFWVGAPSNSEMRREGCFYPPCSGKCKPILRHMLKGIEQLKIEGTNCEKTTKDWSKEIEIIYEDKWLMVVNKPAGLLSVPGRSDEPSLVTILSEQCLNDNLQPAHRLDQDTSGLLVLAKRNDVYKTLQAYFQRRDILKRYEAIVKPSSTSCLQPEEGDINLPLLPNPFDRPRQIVDFEHGKVSLTHYHIRAAREDGTRFIDFYPHTGRTHQLRVHAAHHAGLNSPIVGDNLYGKPAERLMLHAAEIEFTHPITQQKINITAPVPFA